MDPGDEVNEEPNKRPIKWNRTIIYSVLFIALGAWGTRDALASGDPMDWVWVGVAGAGLVVTIVLRVIMRV
jgi:formate-dependent nitrite reductase membrane component NrfD